MSDAPTEEEVIAGMHSMTAEIVKGHNLEAHDEKQRLRSIVDRIVRLEEEKKALASDIKDIYTEAKSIGHTPKALRIVVRRALEDEQARADREAVETEAELIAAALGDFITSPLGDYAARGKH